MSNPKPQLSKFKPNRPQVIKDNFDRFVKSRNGQPFDWLDYIHWLTDQELIHMSDTNDYIQIKELIKAL